MICTQIWAGTAFNQCVFNRAALKTIERPSWHPVRRDRNGAESPKILHAQYSQFLHNLLDKCWLVG